MKQNNVILFDVPAVRENLLPMSYTRPVADFLLGINTLRQKWECLLPGNYSYLTADYLTEKFPAVETDDNIYIASHVVATPALA